MDRKQVSFQLEKTVPGNFLMQGLLGGVLGGFIAAVIAAMGSYEKSFVMKVELASYGVLAAGILGIITATLMWGVVRLTGIQYGAITRLAATSSVLFLSVAVIGRQFNFDETLLRVWLMRALIMGIPVALLVGSQVKPWELFTFGSIPVGEVERRTGSRSILATLGTLPLRLMSIGAIALMLLHSTTQFATAHDAYQVLGMSLLLSIFCLYPLLGAYVTFRSPRKVDLLLLGIVINVPVILLGLLTYLEFVRYKSNDSLYFIVICSSFIGAWVIFLIARLGAKLSPVPTLNIFNNKSIVAAPSLDHECLGSRFAEWQQRVA
jgi:hypothetical protein